MALVKELMEAIHFACTFSFWRMGVLWTFALVYSYIKLRARSVFTRKKTAYPRSAVSPLPPMASSSSRSSSSTPGKTLGNCLPICVITGATSGLGAAAALALSKEGFYVVLGITDVSLVCVLLFSYELHRQLHLTDGSQTISVMAVDPGTVKTNIMREVPFYISQAAFAALWFVGLLQPRRIGVSSTLDAALAPPEASGLYFFGGNGRTVESSALSYNIKLSRELWDTSCDIFQDSLLIYNRDSVCSGKGD